MIQLCYKKQRKRKNDEKNKVAFYLRVGNDVENKDWSIQEKNESLTNLSKK